MMGQTLHALAWYFPDSSGGTEVYVGALIRELQALGVGAEVIAASDDQDLCEYVHNGVPVTRYPVRAATTPWQLRGDEPHWGFERFVAWLREKSGAIYHQHAWTYACGLHHLEAAKALGFRTVLTVHVPSNLCMRGTMMRFGNQACDGRLDEHRCAACWAQGRGLPRSVATMLARMPARLSRGAADAARQTRLTTALGARALAQDKRAQFGRMVAAADRIVAVCVWLQAALRRNGVPEAKLVLSRQGVGFDPAAQAAAQLVADKTFHVGFLGRWHQTKGLHVLLDALRLLPAELPIQLHIFGMCSSDEDRACRAKVLAGLEGDPRLEIEQPVARGQVPAVLARLHLLAVPSQCLETGPLVVLEAQAMGVPVLGSRLGGIQELVTHGVDGWLVDPHDRAAWADAMVRAATGRLLPAPAEPRRRVRHMADAARDMAGLYESLLADAQSGG